ncbi:MAG: polynucleotide adenylyltransferase PcnB [bacterium]
MLKSLKRFIKKSPSPRTEPRVLTAGQHPLKPEDISRGARKVIETLVDEGFDAYVVGGCVRDMLLGLHPKDFDVATNATPEQVHAIFRRSRIVGRRFQIVHVRVRAEVIEVTTFRANHEEASKKGRHQSRQSSEGLLLRDNIFGSIEDDAARRDFTVNALYYHPQDNTLIDYADGLGDIASRTLRMIGDPETRYREDPVRMLRAARFSAKLGFSIEPATAQLIPSLANLLLDVSPARLFDESLKLFMSGHAEDCWTAMQHLAIAPQLFPDVVEVLNADPESPLSQSASRLIQQALINTDERLRQDKRVTPAFIFAALLWPVVAAEMEAQKNPRTPKGTLLNNIASKALARQCAIIAIPRRFTMTVREIWELQLQLPLRRGSRAERLMSRQRFRAGYDFLLLREGAGEIEPGLGEWWTRYQEAEPEERQRMVDELPPGDTQRRPRKRRRRKSRNTPPQNG